LLRIIKLMSNFKSLLSELVKRVIIENKSSVDMSGQWVAWPSASKRISYQPTIKGVGPGEERLAKMMKGQVMGGGVSHDIEGPDGTTWEVKEPVGGKIRAGIEGTTASIKMRTEIDNVVNIIVNTYAGSRTKAGFKALFRKQQLDTIRQFVISEVPMIRKAEISNGRMLLMLDVLNLINQAIHGADNLNSTDADDVEQKFVELGDEKKTVRKDIDTATFVKIGQQLGLPNEELNITEKDIFKSIFSNMAFTEPDKWFKMYWTKGASASDVFGHCTGVILVSEDGYKVINHSQLNREIIFFSISQSRTQFKVS
jgi:hypothetical protein